MLIQPNDIFLRKLNSATQYPSIPTLHKLGERGQLTEEVRVTFTSEAVWTEKVDGTNTRIILTGDISAPVIVGSRNELLWAHGDLIRNPTLGILDAVDPYLPSLLEKGMVNSVTETRHIDTGFLVLYGEVYGGKVGQAARNYTSTGALGFRLFDIAIIPNWIFDKDIEQIAQWRDNLFQPFMGWLQINALAGHYDIPMVPLVHYSPLPTNTPSVQDVYDTMSAVMRPSQVALDGVGGKPEGYVLRSHSGSKMAKIRFQDYERTLRVVKK